MTSVSPTVQLVPPPPPAVRLLAPIARLLLQSKVHTSISLLLQCPCCYVLLQRPFYSLDSYIFHPLADAKVGRRRRRRTFSFLRVPAASVGHVGAVLFCSTSWVSQQNCSWPVRPARSLLAFIYAAFYWFVLRSEQPAAEACAGCWASCVQPLTACVLDHLCFEVRWRR